MAYHIEFILFELIKFYQENTKEDTINLEDLKEAFYTLQDSINKRENLNEKSSFEEALEALEEICLDSIRLTDTDLTIEDINIIFNELLLKFENLTAIDASVEDYVANICIYKALHIPLPLHETKDYFAINNHIIQIYILLAKYELEKKDPKLLLFELHLLLTSLHNMIENTNKEMLNKLKVCCAYYKNLYLLDTNSPYQNAAWHIILFGETSSQIKSLGYRKLMEEISLRELELVEEESKEETENLEPEEEEAFDRKEKEDFLDEEELIDDFSLNLEDEDTIFLGILLYDLNTIINIGKDFLPKEVLEKLTVKAYFLLSLPELADSESIFIERREIARPVISDLMRIQASFKNYNEKALACSEEFNHQDKEIINNEALYTHLIICALFIRTFLELSNEEEIKNQIKNQLINANFYKNPAYSMITNLIDNIIFSENLKYTR